MELRKAGVPLEGEGARLSLDLAFVDWESVGDVLPEVDHPIAEEARGRQRAATEGRRGYGVEALGPSEKLKVWLAERLIEEQPEAVLGVLAAHGREMIYDKPTQELLDLYLDAAERVPGLTKEKVKVRQYAAHVADNLTRYALARKLFFEVIEMAQALDMGQEVTQVYGALAHHYAETHDFESAMRYGEMAVEKAMAIDNPRSASGAMINLGHIYGQQLRYEEAVTKFTEAFDLADSIDFEGQKSVAVGSLAFYWGVLGCPVEPRILDQAKRQASLGYMAVVDAYAQFSLAVGHGDASGAAVEAATQLRLTSESGMERMFYVALDSAAIALAMQGRGVEAAVVVRAGTRFRRNFSGGRSPVEREVVRRHVAGPFFGKLVEAGLMGLEIREPKRLAEEVEGLLE
jgi:tetratricopeptide (TPR) repeat protein